MDIALENKELDGFGGILIRGLYDVKEGEKDQRHFKGPLICAMKIFSGMSAFSESKAPEIIKKEFKPLEIIKRPRKGLGKNAEESGTNKLNYNFSIKINGK